MATRESAPRERLLRVVRAPDGTLAVDVRGALPGRGAWVVPTRAALGLAFERGAFARAFEAPVLGDPEALGDEAERVLQAEVLHALGLLRRMGELAPGRSEVEDAARQGRLTALVLAHDLAPRSAHELRVDVPTAVAPSKDDIGEALGRGPTGVVGLCSAGPRTERLLQDLARLASLAGWAIPGSFGSELSPAEVTT